MKTQITDSVALKRRLFSVSGMSCAGCANRLQRTLRENPDIADARVNFASATAVVESSIGADDLTDIARDIGFGFTPGLQRSGDAAAAEAAALVRHRVEWIIGAILSAPLLVAMATKALGGPELVPVWIQAVIATIVVALIGRHFAGRAFTALRHRSANMDVLVTLGAGTAFVFSLVQMLFALGGPVFFEGAALVLTFVHFGKWLEERTKSATGKALDGLIAMKPETATVIHADGEARALPTEQIVPGDVVRVRPGERMPVDGQVLRGDGDVDTSHLTGESLPLHVSAGADVPAGALNGAAVLELTATSDGVSGAIDRIADMVREAQDSDSAAARLADRISAVFVPGVLVIATLTLLGWGLIGLDWTTGIAASVAVLVVACPCALGLAAPVAIVAGVGGAARRGIIIRNGIPIERAEAVKTVLLDKTGTLTNGQFRITGIDVFAGQAETVDRVAASLLADSTHPLAQSVVKARRAEAEGLEERMDVPGQGVSALWKGKPVAAGRRSYLESLGMELPATAAAPESTGSEIWVGLESEIIGCYRLADSARDDAQDIITTIRAYGMEPALASGDRVPAVSRLAAELGIARWQGEMTPEGKQAWVGELQKDGGVAMVGDGTNDAPAMAQADIGIAVTGATDIAGATADILLIGDDPGRISLSLLIARAISAKIRQNLFWAFFYNCLALPAAALGLLNPAIAGAAMALSSVSVVVNALFLGRRIGKMQ